MQHDEDDLIHHILQDQLPISMPVDELIKELKSSPSTNFFSTDSSLEHFKVVDISPSQTLNINASLPVKQEEKLSSVLRQCLDDFYWDFKEIKGVHPSVYTHNLYIKEG